MITSISNGRIKQLVVLQEKSRARNKEGVFIAEGLKMFEEAPLEQLQEVYCAESLWNRLKQEVGLQPESSNTSQLSENSNASRPSESRNIRLWHKLEQCMDKKILVEQVSDEVLKKAADTQTPQGILFVMQQFSWTLPELMHKAIARHQAGGRAPLFLLLEDIQDPGNLGTMLRTAEGAGVDGVILSKGSVDVYNPKTIRSTMGSLYRVPCIYTEKLIEEIALLKKNKITLFAAHLQGRQFYDEVTYEGGSAFLIGNEANGLSDAISAQADCFIKIPMEGQLESLNAAVAAAILLYQAAGAYRIRG